MRIQRFTVTLLALALLVWLPAAFAQAEDPTGTQWQLVSIDSAPVLADTNITLSLNANGQAGGSSGCNSYGGSYTISAGSITISDLFSTMMACLDDGIMQQETAYLAALQTATQIERSGETLTITYSEGQQLVFAAFDPLLGTQWQLIEIDGTPVIADTTITLEFRFGQQVVGSGGCNSYGGVYILLTGTGLNFDSLISTKMACIGEDIPEQESAFLSTLQTTAFYEMQGDRLTLWTAADQSMTFVLTGRDPLVGTRWQLTAIGGTPVIPATLLTLEFHPGQQVTGSGGCNSYGGGYVLLEGTGLSFDPLTSTKMACAGEGIGEQESTFLSTLQTTAYYELQGDQLTLWTAADQPMTFELAATP
jgi:heat shock protein HslJ